MFSKRLSALILLIAALIFGVSMWLELMPFGQLFMVMVSIAVAAIPEGLPAVSVLFEIFLLLLAVSFLAVIEAEKQLRTRVVSVLVKQKNT